MANESPLVCFRVPAAERALLEVVARHQGQSLSAFVRHAATRVARGIIEEQGAEAVFRKFESIEASRAEEVSARVEEFRARLLPQSPQSHRGSSPDTGS